MTCKQARPPQPENEGINNPFQSLRIVNYRRYWLFMSLSSLGGWVQNAAQPWLAYRMTDSPFMLGLVNAVQFMPIFLFSLFAGVIIDRFSKKWILIATQAGYVLTSLVMAVLVISGNVRYGYVVLIAAFTGILNVFNVPVKQTMISQLVPKESLVNAVALHSITYNLARIIGPALVGLVTARWSVGACYALNLIIFSASTIGVGFVKLPSYEKGQAYSTLKMIGSDVRLGLRYARERRLLCEILITLAITGVFSINFSVLLPVLSVEVLNADALGFGSLMSVVGVGSFVGAFWVALHSRNGPRRFFLSVAPVLLGVLWIVVAVGGSPLIYPALCCLGFFYVSYSATASAALQTHTDDAYIGRMNSLYTLVLAGTSPLGNFFSGTLCDVAGVRWGVAGCGMGAVLCFAAYRLARRRRGQRR